MAEFLGRAEFLAANPLAHAWASLKAATEAQEASTLGRLAIPKGHFEGKRAVIIGAGVGGLTTAYELLAQESGMEVTVLEAQNRTGGRCLTLRTGDTFVEDEDCDLFNSTPRQPQTIRFKHPIGDEEPYLNAGPGRIPSSHKRLLGYLRDFGVPIETYIMNSMSNLVQMEDGPTGDIPIVYRRIDHNVRGWIAQMVYHNAESLLRSLKKTGIKDHDLEVRAVQLKRLMVSFGELTTNGKYVPDEGETGFENARSRAGFEVLPSVDVGDIADALSLDSLLRSEFWAKTRVYQPVDFLWQQSIFQPAGGMDRVEHAFAQNVAARGGTIHLNSPVTSIDWDSHKREFKIRAKKVGEHREVEFRCDYVFSNLAMPFLSRILSKSLQDPKKSGGLAPAFKQSLARVYDTQFNPDPDRGPFLQPTAKVGWQADRVLWQGAELESVPEKNIGGHRLRVPESEVGVVPIFGGISWTDHPIQQIWYPSNDFHGRKGVLTGAYNFGNNAIAYGRMTNEERLINAREGAFRFGKKFAAGLQDGVSIAWQNMPYIKGGWVRWQTIGDPNVAVDTFNSIAAGSGVEDHHGPTKKNFFIVGDQISSLPGWQEGAIAAALNALQQAAYPDIELPALTVLPDPRLMVEGV